MLNLSTKHLSCHKFNEDSYIAIHTTTNNSIKNVGYSFCSNNVHKNEINQKNYDCHKRVAPEERLRLDLSSLNISLFDSRSKSRLQKNENESGLPPPLPPPCRHKQSGSDIPPPLKLRGPKNLPPPPTIQCLRNYKRNQISNSSFSATNLKSKDFNKTESLKPLRILKTQFCTTI